MVNLWMDVFKDIYARKAKINNCIDRMVKNKWKSYIWTADKGVNESDPRSNLHYLGDTSTALYQLS